MVEIPGAEDDPHLPVSVRIDVVIQVRAPLHIEAPFTAEPAVTVTYP